jgi:nuclear pore complex protein Nup155
MKRIAAMSLTTIVQNASLIARTVDKSNFQKLVHIAAISSSESTNMNLVAVTRTGARLYFTVSRFGLPVNSAYSGQQVAHGCAPTNQPFCPEMLSLVHVRLPPGFTARGPLRLAADIHNAYYRQGLLLLLSQCTEDMDQLSVIASDNFPFQSRLIESYEALAVDGRSWAVAEVPADVPLCLCEAPSESKVQRPDPPTVVTQHLQLERKFVIINSQGTYILIKLSPVEQLHELLVNYGADSSEVKAYFKLHQLQASATCLVLMCSRSANHQQVIDLATRAFFLHSGEPELNFAPVSNLPGHPGFTGGLSASTPYQGIGPRQLSFQSPNTSLIAASTSQDIVFSNRHRAVCLYLARILRPIWETRIVKGLHNQSDMSASAATTQTVYLLSQFTSEHLQWILHKLNNLRDFVNSNSLLSHSALNAPGRRLSEHLHVDDQLHRQCRFDAVAEENKSLKQIQLLINNACEYLGLLKILSDHQFHIIASKLTQEQQRSLLTMTFQQLLLSGREVCQSLIKHLIDMYIADSAATDAISNRLRQVCPSLYSCADQVYSKACEKLNAAKKSINSVEKQRLILEAVENYKQIAVHIDLPTASSQLASVRYYKGIVDLVLTAAQHRDPHSLALHYYSNGLPNSDVHGLQAYNLRKDCYKCVTETLDYLLSVGQQQQTPNLPRSPGPPPVHDTAGCCLSAAEAEQYAEEVYRVSLESKDEMFHVALYDWLRNKNMSEKLLSVQSPFIELYLKQGVLTQPDDIGLLDLMWKYHDKQQNFSAASRILAKLAEKQSDHLKLQQRIEYLSRAAVCARSVTSHIATPGDGDFLHELEDKMEVARLQKQIVDCLKPNESSSVVREALKQLDSRLYDISVLYSDFADEFNLSECKLAIIYCADHHDPALIETLWQEIIDKEMSTTSNGTACVKAVSTKLVTLGRIYAASENYFPLAFLVKYLEYCSVKFDLCAVDISFVFHSLLDIGITFSRLIDLYDRLLKSKDPCWQSVGRQYHLLFVIHTMLNEFANRPTLVAAYERRAVAVMSLDIVSQYLVQLQADTSADQDTRQLMTAFKAIQAQLDRLL